MMNIKRLVKRIAPPILVDMYRGYLGYIWKGVYQHYRDVPVAGKGFDGDVWVTESRAYAMVASGFGSMTC